MQTINMEYIFKKHKRGKPITSGMQGIILNVYARLWELFGSSKTVKEVEQETSDLTGVSVRSIAQLRSKWVETGVLRTPGKKRPAAQGTRIRTNIYDDFTLSTIRRKVHQFYERGELPTVKSILKSVNEDETLPSFKRETMRRILLDIGFRFEKRKHRDLLIDREDIIVWRRSYLRAIREFRRQGRTIYYTDETWVNAGHTKEKVWVDTTITSKRNAFLRGLTVGLKNPSGKGKRYVIVHAGNEEGFVKGAALVFGGKNEGDYHGEMDGPQYKNWFKNRLLSNLKPNSVIILDNASYHSVRDNPAPTTAWKVKDIKDWLHKNGVHFNEDCVKTELLKIVNEVKPRIEKYVIDEIAEMAGHTVLRTPPYHCHLNAIEMVWAEVKGHVAAHNTTFKFADIEKLVYEGFQHVTVEHWANYVSHVKHVEEEMWKEDAIVDDLLELNIELSSDENTSSDSESSYDCFESLENLPIAERAKLLQVLQKNPLT